MIEFRKRFPILKSKTYLASHSLGAVPESTSKALHDYYTAWAELGIQAWEGPWWQAILDFNSSIEKILNAKPGSVAPMENATRAMAAVASSLDFKTKRNRIVLTNLEFITSYPFWQGLKNQGAEIILVESEDGISVPVQKILDAIDERTLIIPTSHVYFRSGAIQDLYTLTDHAHKKGAYVLGDGYQSIGTVPFNVTESQIDFYVGGSHKWLCGGPGAGYLYVRPDLIPKLEPKLSGWFGVKDPFSYKTGYEFAYADGAFRFLAGTVSVPALFAAREGLKTVVEVGLNNIRQHSLALTDVIMERADQRGIQIKTPRNANERGGMVCIDFPNSKIFCEKLVENGIIVDWRPNCGIRVSPHFYNNTEDLSLLFDALDEFYRNSL